MCVLFISTCTYVHRYYVPRTRYIVHFSTLLSLSLSLLPRTSTMYTCTMCTSIVHIVPRRFLARTSYIVHVHSTYVHICTMYIWIPSFLVESACCIETVLNILDTVAKIGSCCHIINHVCVECGLSRRSMVQVPMYIVLCTSTRYEALFQRVFFVCVYKYTTCGGSRTSYLVPCT